MAASKFFLFLFVPLVALAKSTPPKWTSASPTKSGSLYTVICQAEGPGIDSARATALRECKRSAVEMKVSATKTKTLIVETEASASLHQETIVDADAQNVVCEPKREFFSEGDGSVQIWVECTFDLNKIKPMNTADRDELQNTQSIVTKKTSITIGTTPRCESILVIGKLSSTVKCESNPVQIVIDGTTTDVIIRALGHKAYHLGKEIRSEGAKDAYNIFLSK